MGKDVQLRTVMVGGGGDAVDATQADDDDDDDGSPVDGEDGAHGLVTVSRAGGPGMACSCHSVLRATPAACCHNFATAHVIVPACCRQGGNGTFI